MRGACGVLSGSVWPDSRASLCSLRRRATASPGSSKVGTVRGLEDFASGLGGARLAGLMTGFRADSGRPFVDAELALSSVSTDVDLDKDSDLRGAIRIGSLVFTRTVAGYIVLQGRLADPAPVPEC